jgi:Cu/Zn superoxide dismutase
MYISFTKENNNNKTNLFIYSRSVVIHSGVDDLGRGGAELSKVSGNSGSKIACGVIGCKFFFVLFFYKSIQYLFILIIH